MSDSKTCAIFLGATEINTCEINTFESTFHNNGPSDLGVDLMQESAVPFMLLKWFHDVRMMSMN